MLKPTHWAPGHTCSVTELAGTFELVNTISGTSAQFLSEGLKSFWVICSLTRGAFSHHPGIGHSRWYSDERYSNYFVIVGISECPSAIFRICLVTQLGFNHFCGVWKGPACQPYAFARYVYFGYIVNALCVFPCQ